VVRDAGAAGLVALVFLAANRILLIGAAAPLWDADSAFAPHQILLADAVRSGTLLVWNPWLNGGSPDYANPEVGALSPVTLLLALAGGPSLHARPADPQLGDPGGRRRRRRRSGPQVGR
jgi:hypothetical protein